MTTIGIEHTIKDGIVYDAKMMLADVRRLVAEQKAKENEPSSSQAFK